MKKIDEFIIQLFKGASESDVFELREEMRRHLIDAASDLKRTGLTEEEAAIIAVMRFGDAGELRKELNLFEETESFSAQALRKVRNVQALLPYLLQEDPAIIAVVASYMEPAVAAELLSQLPEDKMAEVAMGIATMEETSNDVLVRIENHLNKKLIDAAAKPKAPARDGIKTLVGILNNVNRATEKSLFDRLENMDGGLSHRIKSSMFAFEDIAKLSAFSLQRVVNKITDNELIAKALKLAGEEMRTRFYSAMSEGRKRFVNDANEALGKIRVSDAEEAQAKIANIAREMEKNNEIVISRGDEDIIL